MDAIVPAIMGSVTLLVLVQVLFARSSRDRERGIRNTDVNRPRAR